MKTKLHSVKHDGYCNVKAQIDCETDSDAWEVCKQAQRTFSEYHAFASSWQRPSVARWTTTAVLRWNFWDAPAVSLSEAAHQIKADLMDLCARGWHVS